MIMHSARQSMIRMSALALVVHTHLACATVVVDAGTARDVPATVPARVVLPVSNTPAAATVAARSSRPLQSATGVAPGQAGYVHYFLLRMPDDSTEVQVGIELEDQRIAWSFPDLGVVISPFIAGGEVQAGGKTYDVWHLYAIRPFPDDAAMARLRKALPARIGPWVSAGIPYCLDDSPQNQCMSCLGFVLRVLFPGRSGDYPSLPRDFHYTTNPSQYTPNDLLLYLSGMPELPNRNARLQRLAQLNLPDDLRMDLEELVHTMNPGGASTAPRSVPLTSRQKRAGTVRNAPPQKLRPGL